MSLHVLYTEHSKETLTTVYEFIEERFGKKSADQFLIKTEKTIELIAEFPFMFKATSIDVNVRKCVISKQTSLFYRVTETEVHLLFFWDIRQDPSL
jgi:plasmid stabilization system protein ParE